jgi:hypothetical protein
MAAPTTVPRQADKLSINAAAIKTRTLTLFISLLFRVYKARAIGARDTIVWLFKDARCGEW